MTTNTCGSKYGRAQCRVHGKRDRHDAAYKVAQTEYLNYLKEYLTTGFSVAGSEKMVQKAATLVNTQAEIDAYDENYETLSNEIEQLVEDKNPYVNDGTRYESEDVEYRDLLERKERATIVRAKRKGNSNPYNLSVISDEFPHSAKEASRILKINNCGELSGVRGVATQLGKPVYQVVGTQGYYTVDEKGVMFSVGTIHNLSHERTPECILDAVKDVPEGGAVGWKNLYSTVPAAPGEKFPTSKLAGYELFSATGYAITNTSGKVRERGTFLAVT